MFPVPLPRLQRRRFVFTLALLAVVSTLIYLLSSSGHHRGILSSDELAMLKTAPRSQVEKQYEEVRASQLARLGYNATSTAVSLNTPVRFPDQRVALDPDLDAYSTRLSQFISKFFGNASSSDLLQDAVTRVATHHAQPRRDFPPHLFTTDRQGAAGISSAFHFWDSLLPVPLSQKLVDLLAPFSPPVLRHSKWTTHIANDSLIDDHMSKWIGQSISSGGQLWAAIWKNLTFGVLRADIYRYMAILFEGGVYADSDTVPVAHPYMWGLGSKSIVHPSLVAMEQLLDESSPNAARAPLAPPGGSYAQDPHSAKRTPSVDNLASNPHVTMDYRPPYGRHGRDRRSPFRVTGSTPQEATTLLSPEINVVVAIEFDSSIAFSFQHWHQWSKGRYLSSTRPRLNGRSLQFSQYILAGKPFHPIFIDTMCTVMELVETHHKLDMSAIDLTGPGPYTDSVLRYLLVRYGVTPDQLRHITGPVKVGDVLILQEEAYLAPTHAMEKAVSWVNRIAPGFLETGHTNGTLENIWYWGAGFVNWRSAGTRVVYHGLKGSWKSADWTPDSAKP